MIELHNFLEFMFFGFSVAGNIFVVCVFHHGVQFQNFLIKRRNKKYVFTHNKKGKQQRKNFLCGKSCLSKLLFLFIN